MIKAELKEINKLTKLIEAVKKASHSQLGIDEQYDLLQNISDYCNNVTEYEKADIIKDSSPRYRAFVKGKKADIKLLLLDEIADYEVIPPNKFEELLTCLYVSRQALLISVDTFNLGLVFYNYNINQDYASLIPDNIKQDISNANMTIEGFVRAAFDFLEEGAKYSDELYMSCFDTSDEDDETFALTDNERIELLLDRCVNKQVRDILESFKYAFNLDILESYPAITAEILFAEAKK